MMATTASPAAHKPWRFRPDREAPASTFVARQLIATGPPLSMVVNAATWTIAESVGAVSALGASALGWRLAVLGTWNCLAFAIHIGLQKGAVAGIFNSPNSCG